MRKNDLFKKIFIMHFNFDRMLVKTEKKRSTSEELISVLDKNNDSQATIKFTVTLFL